MIFPRVGRNQRGTINTTTNARSGLHARERLQEAVAVLRQATERHVGVGGEDAAGHRALLPAVEDWGRGLVGEGAAGRKPLLWVVPVLLTARILHTAIAKCILLPK